MSRPMNRTLYRIKAGVRPYPQHILQVREICGDLALGHVRLPSGHSATGERGYYVHEIEPVTPVMIAVIDREHLYLGRVESRLGLETYSGPITRWNEKGSIWVMTKDGERCYRAGDHRPSVYKSKLMASDKFTPKEAR